MRAHARSHVYSDMAPGLVFQRLMLLECCHYLADGLFRLKMIPLSRAFWIGFTVR